MGEPLAYDTDDGVAVVTLDRPDPNALPALWRALAADEGVRAVVVTGTGDEVFVHLPPGDDPAAPVGPKANELWKPVVAAVGGVASGDALTLLGEADIVLAAEHATFVDPRVTDGEVAGYEAVQLLAKLPLGEVLRVALLGANERMSAERAHQVGLVSEVVPAGDLLERARWVAAAIADAPALAVEGTVKAIWMGTEVPRRQALDQVSTWVSLGTAYDNIAGGQEAFQGPRTKEWRLR